MRFSNTAGSCYFVEALATSQVIVFLMQVMMTGRSAFRSGSMEGPRHRRIIGGDGGNKACHAAEDRPSQTGLVLMHGEEPALMMRSTKLFMCLIRIQHFIMTMAYNVGLCYNKI